MTPPPQADPVAVADLLFRVGAAFDGFTSQMRRALTLNANERLAISILWSRGPQTMTDLGAGIPLSRAAVTALVDRLEEAGLVARGSDGTDRRQTVVSVTDETLDRMRPVIAPWIGTLHRMVGEREPEAWATIVSFRHDFVEMNRRETDLLAGFGDDAIQELAEAGAPTARRIP